MVDMRLVAVLVLVAFSTKAVADDDLIPGKTPLSVEVDPKLDAVIIKLEGPAPAIEAMRAEVKAAQARVTASSQSPSRGVIISYVDAGLLAASLHEGDRFTTQVGNGSTMIDDAADFTLSASPIAKTDSFMVASWAESQKISCSGTLKNTGSVPIDAAVTCSVIGEFDQRAGFDLHAAGKTVTHTMGTTTKALGKLAPGASKAYSIIVTHLTGPGSGDPLSRMSYNFLGMTFATSFAVDGKPTPHYDSRLAKEGVAWLGLIATARSTGFRFDDTNWHRGGFPTFSVGDEFTSLAAPKRKAAAMALAAKLNTHYRTYFGDPPYVIYFEQGTKPFARIEDGAYKEN
jgi:hypothetical protein